MSARSWTIRSERVVLPDGMRPATIHVEDGRIVAIDDWSSVADSPRTSGAVIDVGAQVVLPGLVDTHVHINEPGRTEWEGFETATSAAAAGGITTLVDMPLNSIPATTTVAALEIKRAAARAKCHVDVGFWGGVVPSNEPELEPLAKAGVLGYKCFLTPSGVDEFQHVTEADLRVAMPHVAATGLPLLAHAEWPAALRAINAHASRTAYATWLDSRPPKAEAEAIAMLARLARASNARLHIVHVASTEALAEVVTARASGVLITAETCPHYLSFCAEDIHDGATPWKCAPPIRERAHQDRLWRGLIDGEIDLAATDHSPAPASLKHVDDGDFVAAWGGIASLQIALPVMWTHASRRGIGIERLAQWMSAAPARLAGLQHRKGAIAVGHDADFAVFDPDREFIVNAERLYHRHPITPYDGARLRGVVTMTMLRGQVIYEHDARIAAPMGELL